LNTDSESLPITDAGSGFQTGVAAHRKERFAKSIKYFLNKKCKNTCS